jgi:type IV secretory pathway VirB2 component (pilin)
MRKFYAMMVVGAVSALAFSTSAFAAVSLTPPTLNVDGYAEGIFSGLTANLADILTVAGIVTGVAVGFGMLKRYIGHRKATRI